VLALDALGYLVLLGGAIPLEPRSLRRLHREVKDLPGNVVGVHGSPNQRGDHARLFHVGVSAALDARQIELDVYGPGLFVSVSLITLWLLARRIVQERLTIKVEHVLELGDVIGRPGCLDHLTRALAALLGIVRAGHALK